MKSIIENYRTVSIAGPWPSAGLSPRVCEAQAPAWPPIDSRRHGVGGLESYMVGTHA